MAARWAITCRRGGDTESVRLVFPEYDVPHAVAELDAALFEFGQWAVVRFGGITGNSIGHFGFGSEYGEDVISIFLPVSCDVEISAGLEFVA